MSSVLKIILSDPSICVVWPRAAMQQLADAVGDAIVPMEHDQRRAVLSAAHKYGGQVRFFHMGRLPKAPDGLEVFHFSTMKPASVSAKWRELTGESADIGDSALPGVLAEVLDWLEQPEFPTDPE